MTKYQAMQRSLARGWNTWNTRSVLSHVLLPEGFALNLGFKSYAHSALIKEALIERRGENCEKIRPGAHACDGACTDLHIQWKDVDARVQSATDGDDLILLITPTPGQRIKPPALVVEAGILWNRAGAAARDGNVLLIRSDSRTVKCYTTAEPAVDPYVGATGPYLALPLAEVIVISTGRPRTVGEAEALVARRAAEHQTRIAGWGALGEIYDAIQTCTGWDTLYEPLKDRVVTPVSRLWNTEQRGGYVLFCWDTYFAAALAAVDNRELAYANAVEITRELTPGGFVPNNTQATGRTSSDRSQPPVGSTIVRELYMRYKELWLLEEVFANLLIWNRWWHANRRHGDLLCWGSQPFKPAVGDPKEFEQPGTPAGAALESGLDNSPMYDGATFDSSTHLMRLHDVGLNSLYIADCDALADIAEALGRPEAVELRSRGESYRQAMQSLWDEKTGLFLNRRTDTNEFEYRLSPTHFYPLLARAADDQQARRMIQEHLLNPAEFWGDWILPSIARNDPAYPEQTYWRGRVWAPMNYLVYLGLKKYPCPEVARQLAEKSASLLMKEWKEHRHIHENYNADTGQGCDSARSEAFYHWGGLLGLMMIVESQSQQLP